MTPTSTKKDRQYRMMALELQFHLNLNLDFDLHLDSTGTKGDVCLKSLRIKIPDEEPPHSTEKERPVEKKSQGQEKEQEQEQDDVEYVAVSPRYTWSDEQIRGIKQERFGELLWPIVLHSYGITDTTTHFATYSSFRRSAVCRHPQNYPHHSLRELMEWYIEDHLHLLKKGETWTENLKRRWLLRRRFQERRLVWAPEYFEMYLTWSMGCRAGMNRYQKMEKFISEFFL